MNKHGLGVGHGRGGLFYRLYFITVCHLHGGMLIASCDYLHIWKSTSICHAVPLSHESSPASPQPNNCCLFARWQAAPAPGRHLHLPSCRLTYVNHQYTKHRASHLASSPPHFSRLRKTSYFCTRLEEGGIIIREAHESNEQQAIKSNQSERDYTVNYLYSHLG